MECLKGAFVLKSQDLSKKDYFSIFVKDSML